MFTHPRGGGIGHSTKVNARSANDVPEDSSRPAPTEHMEVNDEFVSMEAESTISAGEGDEEQDELDEVEYLSVSFDEREPGTESDEGDWEDGEDGEEDALSVVAGIASEETY